MEASSFVLIFYFQGRVETLLRKTTPGGRAHYALGKVKLKAETAQRRSYLSVSLELGTRALRPRSRSKVPEVGTSGKTLSSVASSTLGFMPSELSIICFAGCSWPVEVHPRLSPLLPHS
jgi:hypothetical protein